MASRLKYFAALVLGCVAITLWLRLWHPDRGMPTYYRARIARMPQQMKTADEIAKALRMHAQLTVADTAERMLAASRDSIVIVQSSRMLQSPAVLPSIVANELATRTPLRARIGVFVFNSDVGTYPSAFSTPDAEPTIYLTGSDQMGPYCITAMHLPAGAAIEHGLALKLTNVLPDTSALRQNQRRSLLGPCVFWAQYGPPGAGVERWLRQGGYHFALAPAALLAKPEFRERRLFGHRGWSPPDINAYACQSGDERACAKVIGLNGPRDSAAQYAAHQVQRFDDYPRLFSYRDAAMLAHLEKEFGAQKFATFWHSSLAPDAAFSAAFGTSFAEWTRSWAQKWFGVEVRGPGIDPASWAMCLALLATLTFVSYMIARNRQIL